MTTTAEKEREIRGLINEARLGLRLFLKVYDVGIITGPVRDFDGNDINMPTFYIERPLVSTIPIFHSYTFRGKPTERCTSEIYSLLKKQVQRQDTVIRSLHGQSAYDIWRIFGTIMAPYMIAESKFRQASERYELMNLV